MTLKRLGQLLVVVSVLLTLITAFGIQKYIKGIQAQFGTTVKVTVAAQPIPTGTVITERMLDYRFVPLQALLPGMVRVENKADLVGQTLVVAMHQGDVFTENMTGIAQVSMSNARTYTLYLSDRIVFPSDLAPGDQVDILASFKDAKDGKQTSKVVLEDAKVLNVRKEDRQQAVVLVISAADAETVAWYENFGQQLRLLKRS